MQHTQSGYRARARTDLPISCHTHCRVGAIVAALLLAVLTAFSAHAQETSGAPGSPGATTTIDGRYLPNPPQPFRGEISPKAVESKPYWPARVVPPKGGRTSS